MFDVEVIRGEEIHLWSAFKGKESMVWQPLQVGLGRPPGATAQRGGAGNALGHRI